MAVSLEVVYSKVFPSLRTLPDTFAYMTDFKKAILPNFPGLKGFEEKAPLTFEWIFNPVRYGSFEIPIEVTTRFELSQNKQIKMISLPGEGNSSLKGFWDFDEGKVKFSVEMDTELPFLGFLKGMITPLAEQEIEKLFDKYVGNVTKALAK
jgi:carbon monoxide dehydrogenase subunit G